MTEPDWWRSAVIYQVYLRSFSDGNDDGTGDIAGIRARLDHLAGLGVDALWINPWYPSPQADGGYDVADYRDIDPRYGTIAEAEELIAEAHARGLRILLDIVPNHTSSAHPWFPAALAAGPGSPERARFLFRPGKGPDGAEPPNDWQSMFGGPAWTRVTEADGQPGEWYLHLFDVEQPDLDWTNPEVRADFVTTLKFWFDRGVDGFRIDVANSLAKQDGLPDVGDRGTWEPGGGHPHWDRDDVHDVWQEWRRVADAYDPPRTFVAEAWVPDPERLALYLRPDELHTAFNFDFLLAAWTAAELRGSIDQTLREHVIVGAPPTWVLSNHDVARHVSRLARVPEVGRRADLDQLLGHPADLELGLRRARAAALLVLALPGGAYVYQGEEFGLPEVEDLPEEVLQDPTWIRSGRTRRGRDGCRVPIPWSGEKPPFGFSATAAPWLPQPEWFADFTAESQEADPGSMLHLYRAALALRREQPALGDGPLTWLDAPEGALAFAREPGFSLLLNVSAEPVELPAGEVLLASGPLADGRLPAETAVWIARP